MQLVGYYGFAIESWHVYNLFCRIVADIRCILFLLVGFQQCFNPAICMHIEDIAAPRSHQVVAVANGLNAVPALG